MCITLFIINKETMYVMTETKNHMNLLFELAMKSFAAGNTEFPPDWSKDKKISFLDESLKYALKHEYYEQCGVIRDYKQQIEEKG